MNEQTASTSTVEAVDSLADRAQGRALDALVAQHVMGYSDVRPVGMTYVGTSPEGKSVVIDSHSATLGDAGAVLSKMTESGWTYELTGEANHLPDAWE